MLVGPLSVWGIGYCSCWTTWPWYWVLQRAAVVLQTSTTRVARFVSSPLPRSPSLSVDGSRLTAIPPTSHPVQSVTFRECALMLTNVGRLHRSHPLTRSCLPSSLPKPRELLVKKRKLESLRETAPCAGAADLNKGRTDIYPKTTRRRRTCVAPPPRRVVFPRAEPSHRSHGLLDGINQVRRMDSKLLGCSPRRAGSGPSPMGICSRNDGVTMVERRTIRGDARGPVCGSLEAQRVVQPGGLVDAASKASITPLWSRSQARYGEVFAKWAKGAGVSVITTHPSSVR